MNPNLSTNFAAIQAERSRLDARAERGWQAEQADCRRPALKAIGARIGIALVTAGEHLQGLPRRSNANGTGEPLSAVQATR